ncbi:hypothetical protein KYK30_31460 [Shinella yambaruensis]|uniref:Uncharacterized protein n=1 Tax=Shinella yambaruensis TaxID=415996 RepID=A0ABQ5ZQS3_9HYPH|nr:hypothetical protein [Shinella yambaruensis]MCJ8029960.1 hypothetical protein [Shinella yambaruensis]MCU7984242.1 hypothetical protein [Shinella yambaruensis]GLR55210.1 hypothetical protein GCM10007923_64320 [Shinella yambaruensis]
MARKAFAPELLARLREMAVTEALDRLELYWKADPSFRPVKDKDTKRVNVSVGGGVIELLVNGPKWYDTRQKRGGGGAIDLAMHVLRLDFVSAVKRLAAS